MERGPKSEARRMMLGRVVFALIVAIIMIIAAPGGLTGSKSSEKSGTSRSSYYNYEPGSNYRYVPKNSTGGSKFGTSRPKSGTGSSKSGISRPKSGTGSGSRSGTTGGRSSTYTQKSSKQKAYDDFLDDALENYLAGVDSDEEYWDAVENFDESWLLPDEKEELDRLMKSYE